MSSCHTEPGTHAALNAKANEPEAAAYLLAGQASELDRLRLQSLVWEPAGRALLQRIKPRAGCRALDAGCGVLGWLRVLSEWAGPSGCVVGTDIDAAMLAKAHHWVESQGLRNVSLVRDDLFASRLEPASFDLVHARFQIAPLGRGAEQVAAYARLLRAGGTLVLEDPDMSTWRVSPDAPAVQALISLIARGFLHSGGNFNAGRELAQLLRSAGMEPRVTPHVVRMEPGHPYLRLPLQFAKALRPHLERLVPGEELDALVARAEAELARPETRGTTFTLVQAFATL